MVLQLWSLPWLLGQMCSCGLESSAALLFLRTQLLVNAHYNTRKYTLSCVAQTAFVRFCHSRLAGTRNSSIPTLRPLISQRASPAVFPVKTGVACMRVAEGSRDVNHVWCIPGQSVPLRQLPLELAPSLRAAISSGREKERARGLSRVRSGGPMKLLVVLRDLGSLRFAGCSGRHLCRLLLVVCCGCGGASCFRGSPGSAVGAAACRECWLCR